MSRKTRENVFSYLASLLLAAIFCLKFSVTTSPFYQIDGTDSAIFSIIGKYWADGSIPYLDLWDHKGPIIFFINCLGYLLTGNEFGILLLQICSLSVFVLFTYKTFRLYFKQIISALLSIVSLFWLACSYEGGNLTEEYLLPYLATAFYYIAKWIKEKEESGASGINPWYSFLLGFILAFAFLTRLTNALSSCGIMLGICIVLIIDKDWKSLFQSVLFYLAGFLTLCIPFVVYFYCHDALDEMMYGTLFYNISNISVTTEKNSSLEALFSKDHVLFLIMAVNCYGLLLFSVYSLFSRRMSRCSAIIWLSASLLLGLWYLRCEPMSHYRTLAVPFFPVLFSLLYLQRKSISSWILVPILFLLIAGPSFLTLRKFNRFVDFYDNSSSINALQDIIKNNVPDEELYSFTTYNINPDLFLALDIKPLYKHFSFPEIQAAKSKALEDDIIKDYSECRASWILKSGEHTLIDSILQESYIQQDISPGIEGYTLWKKIK